MFGKASNCLWEDELQIFLIFIHNWEHENKMILLKFNSQMPWYRVVNNECLQVVIQGLGAILAMFKQFQTLPGILVHDGLFHGSSEGPLLQGVGSGSHGTDAFINIDIGRAGNLHCFTKLKYFLKIIIQKFIKIITFALTCLMPCVPSKLICKILSSAPDLGLKTRFCFKIQDVFQWKEIKNIYFKNLSSASDVGLKWWKMRIIWWIYVASETMNLPECDGEFINFLDNKLVVIDNNTFARLGSFLERKEM